MAVVRITVRATARDLLRTAYCYLLTIRKYIAFQNKAPRVRRFALVLHFLEGFLVASLILALEILEVSSAVGDHLDEAAAGVIVLLVGLQMRRKLVDLARKDGNLHLRRAGVGVVDAALLDDILFLFGGKHKSLSENSDILLRAKYSIY